MLVFIFALLIGLIVGLLGSGPAILSLALLLYVKSESLATSVLMSLIIGGVLSFTGGCYKIKNASIKSILLFLPTSLVGSFFGTKYFFLVSEFWKIILLSCVSFMAAGLIFFKLYKQNKLNKPDFLTPVLNVNNIIFFILFGYCLGFLSSFLGISAGFLIAPILVGALYLNISTAIATSLLLSIINSVVALFFYYQKNGINQFLQLDWTFLSWFLILGIIGVVLGIKFSQHASQRVLKKYLGIFLIFLGFLNLYQAFLV
ncbi:MAG: sulfite exporter TauE/SafE family protein [Bdellovibrionales bacterium]|nr:sulfite exporter TauE/SafE family protein [Bdellovibrionales bacterium]